MNKQIVLDSLNETKQEYLKYKSSYDVVLINIYCGKYLGMAFAYLQCSIISIEEYSKLLEDL